MDAEAIVKQFRVIMTGDGGVGKTTYIKKFIGPEKNQKPYIMNVKYESASVVLSTNHGPIKLELIDTCGQQRLGGLREAYFLNCDAAIIMFDLTSRITYKNIPRWHKDITRVQQNLPIVIAGSKFDLQQRKIKPKQITYPVRKNLPYCQISSKCNYNWHMPLLQLLRLLTKDQNLQLIIEPELTPSIGSIDPVFLGNLSEEWNKVQEQVQEDQDD